MKNNLFFTAKKNYPKTNKNLLREMIYYSTSLNENFILSMRKKLLIKH